MEYMNKHGYGQEDIKIMESGFKIQWIDDDPSLPEGTLSFVFCFIILTFKPSGWKMRVTDMKTKNGSVAMQWFLSPEGKMFRGRKSTLEHITKCGKYSVEDIRNFRCSGDTPTKSPYDWNDSDSTVPNGWKTTMITVTSHSIVIYL